MEVLTDRVIGVMATRTSDGLIEGARRFPRSDSAELRLALPSPAEGKFVRPELPALLLRLLPRLPAFLDGLAMLPGAKG